MIIDYNSINKFPVVIISSPRTGSTSLAYDICKTFPNLKLFNEPGNTPENKIEFENYIENNNYVLKLHWGDIHKYREDVYNIIDKSYKIRIRRRNVLEQIVSYYIELNRKVWGYYSTNSYNNLNTIIPLDIMKSTAAIMQTIKNNKVLDECNYNFDLDVYYEDLKFINEEMIMTPRPDNYKEVCEYIRKQLPKNISEKINE